MSPRAIFNIMYQRYGNLIALPNALTPTLLRDMEKQTSVLISSLKTRWAFVGCINYEMVTNTHHFPEPDVRNYHSICSDTVWESKHNSTR